MTSGLRRALTFGIVIAALAGGSSSPPARLVAQAPRYSYIFENRLQTLTPSPRLLAVADSATGPQGLATLAAAGAAPVTDHPALTARGLRLYDLPSPGKSTALAATTALRGTQADLAQADIATAPVFEAGEMVAIPWDEVIVGFARATDLAAAEQFVAPIRARLRLLDVRALGENRFLVRIERPDDGRAFEVSRELSAVPDVAYAEPNFLLLRTDALSERVPAPPLAATAASGPPAPVDPLAGPAAMVSPDVDSPSPVPQAVPGWTTLLSDGFESNAGGWTTFVAAGAPNAVPVYVTSRAHTGSRSLYMTGGGTAGVPPPGPYPNFANTTLLSPPLNLAGYEEVYVELWFYARYEAPDSASFQFFDYTTVSVTSNAGSDLGQLGRLTALSADSPGDLTVDPTTQNGWRRALYRVHLSARLNGVKIAVKFTSDSNTVAEGIYLDDVRVVATANVDTQPISNDPYSGRQYELNNVGQIAGVGGGANDMNVPEAWAIAPTSSSLVVAVIDEGVEPHPDLNLVQGYDGETGGVGGRPHALDENHGQECAGNIGAIANNGIGVAGVAPGVKIMPVYKGSSTAAITTAIDLARVGGARVMSNSWGFPFASADVQGAVQRALAAGRVMLFAAGNGPDRPPFDYDTRFPCNMTATTDVICVGASSQADEFKGASSADGLFTWGSSYVGAGPDVVAPAPWSYTTDRVGSLGANSSAAVTGVDPNYTFNFGGTSSATPKVAGVVALMLSVNPSLTPAQVKSILRSTAKDIDAAGVDDRTGAGRVDALAAVTAARGSACTYTLSSTSLTALSNGHAATVTVTAPGGCAWTAVSNASWIIITSGAAGSGSGQTAFAVSPNLAAARTGTMTIAGQTFTVNQAAPSTTLPTLTVTRTGGGLGTVFSNIAGISCGTDCSEPFTTGAVVALTPNASPGSVFAGWRAANTDCLDGIVTMNASLTCTAVFVTRLPAADGLSKRVLDLNGDGGADVFRYNVNTGAWALDLGDRTGQFGTVTGQWSADWKVYPADFNGDGLTDLFLYSRVTGQWFKCINLGGGQWSYYQESGWSPGWDVTIADLNRDGKSDVFVYDSRALGFWFRCITTGDGTRGFSYVRGQWPLGYAATAMELDGDGYPDLFVYNKTTGQWFRAINDRASGFVLQFGAWSPEWDLYPGDFTADGKSDFLLYNIHDGVWFTAVNTGVDWIYQRGQWSPAWKMTPGDFDGNGRQDLYLYDPVAGNQFICFSDGAGGWTYVKLATISEAWSIAATDFNGDGRSDLFFYNPIYGVYYQAITIGLGQFAYTGGQWASGWTIVASR